MDAEIAGLEVIEDFVGQGEERAILAQLARGPWETEPSIQCRRVQHYGFRYHVNTKEVSEARAYGELPEIAQRVGQAIAARFEAFNPGPNQASVNEYEGGQSIVMHSDHPGLGPCIATLSLGAHARMKLRKAGGDEGDRTHDHPALAHRAHGHRALPLPPWHHRRRRARGAAAGRHHLQDGHRPLEALTLRRSGRSAQAARPGARACAHQARAPTPHRRARNARDRRGAAEPE